MTNSKKNKVSRLSLAALVLAVAAVLAACPADQAQPQQPKGEKTSLYSDLLGIRLTYDAAIFADVAHSSGQEFPLVLKAGGYALGIKKISGAGALLAKEPQADFFQFFGQQVRYNLIDDLKLKPVGREEDQEFTAQGKPGLRQVMRFSVPDPLVPGTEQFNATPGGELYLYYHHFYASPDYYYFVLMADHALPQETLDLTVSLIDTAEFNAQPAPEEAEKEITE